MGNPQAVWVYLDVVVGHMITKWDHSNGDYLFGDVVRLAISQADTRLERSGSTRRFNTRPQWDAPTDSRYSAGKAMPS